MCCRPCQKNGKPYSLVEVLGCDGLFAGIVGRIVRKSSLGESNLLGGLVVVGNGEVSSITPPSVYKVVIAKNVLHQVGTLRNGDRNRFGLLLAYPGEIAGSVAAAVYAGVVALCVVAIKESTQEEKQKKIFFCFLVQSLRV
jgi:hypothetical protein